METVEVVLCADTHLGFDLPLRPRVERRRRGDDFFANYERVLAHVLATRPDALVHGGDFFHASRVAAPFVERAFTALRAVAEAGIPVVVTPGNHERSRLPMSPWWNHSNIHVLDQPRAVILDCGGVRVAVGGFPFFRGDVRGAFRQLLNRSELLTTRADLRLLTFHQAVAGATVGAHNFTFRNGREVVARKDIPNAVTAVLAGHIHRAQVLDDGAGPPVFYPGSTERTSYAERFEKKGFFHLTFASDGSGAWSVAETSVVELPARPMVEVCIPRGLVDEPLISFLRHTAAALPEDAIVRIDGESLGTLDAPTLRSVFPPTMNVDVRWAWADARQ